MTNFRAIFSGFLKSVLVAVVLYDVTSGAVPYLGSQSFKEAEKWIEWARETGR